MSNLRQYAAKSNKSPDKSPSSLQVASPRKSPSSQPSLVPYPDSESMDGDSAEETTGPPIENGHSNEDNGTSVDKYFLGPEVNQNIPGLNISTEDMEPCSEQMQCDASQVHNVPDQVFSLNESYDANDNSDVSALMDGLVQNQSSVSYGNDLPNNSSLPPPPLVHQIVPPVVQNNQPSDSMILLDDEEPNVEPTNTNGPVPNVPQFPDDANYFMPSDKDEVVKVWGQFPQWSRYCQSAKDYTAARRALLEGRDLNSGIDKLRKPPPGKPNEAYLANEQVEFNCFYEIVERTRTHPDQIGTCALIRPTTWVSIAPESAKTLPNRKIVYEPGYQDKNDPRSRLGDHVLKAFFGETGRAKHAKHFQQKIDYFEIEQIFIPIIEEEHWSLAIVNHPRKAFKKLLQGITRQQVAEEEEKYNDYSKRKERLKQRIAEYIKEINEDRNDLEFANVDVDAELEKFKKRLEEEQAEEEEILQKLEEEQQAKEEAMEDELNDQNEEENAEPSEDSSQETLEEEPKKENLDQEDNIEGSRDTELPSEPSVADGNNDEHTESKSDTEQVIDKLEEQTLESKVDPKVEPKVEPKSEPSFTDDTSTKGMETDQPSSKQSSSEQPLVEQPLAELPPTEQSPSEQPPTESKEEESNDTKSEKDDDNESCPTDSEIPDDEPDNLEPSDPSEDQNKEESIPSESDEPSEPIMERIEKIYRLQNDIKTFQDQIDSMEEVKAPDEPTEDDPVIYILCSLRSGEEKGRMKCDAINHVFSHMLVYENNGKTIPAFDKYREEMKKENPDLAKLWMDKETLHWKDLLPFQYRFPLVPHQVNDYDCGLFVSKFIQMYLDKENRPPMTADKDELETVFPPREIFDLKFKYRNLLRELRGEPKEEVNIDGEAEENGYLATLEESLAWGRIKKDQDRQSLLQQSYLNSFKSEDSEDYSSDEDSELEDDEEDDPMEGDLYAAYQLGDIGRRDEYPNQESIQRSFPPFEARNDINHYDFENDNGEESEEDTDNALAKALANITKDTTAPKLREIKKSLSDHSLNEHVPDTVSEPKSDLPLTDNAIPVLENSSNSETHTAQLEKEYLPDKTLQIPSIDNIHPNAEENQNESESPQPKLPKPSSPAIQKPAVGIKTTLENVKDKTEIPKTRLKSTSESKEILEKKEKDKQDRLYAISLHSEINRRPQRKSRQSNQEHIPVKKNTMSRKMKTLQNNINKRRNTIAIPTENSVTRKPAGRPRPSPKQDVESPLLVTRRSVGRPKPPQSNQNVTPKRLGGRSRKPTTPKTEPLLKRKRVTSTSSSIGNAKERSSLPSTPKQRSVAKAVLKSTQNTPKTPIRSEPKHYSQDTTVCFKIGFNVRQVRNFYENDHDSLSTLSEIEILESMPKTSSSNTEDRSRDTEESPMDDTEKSPMNMEMSPVIEN